MNNKDYDHIARVEKAIKQKYGEEAVANPRQNWDETKEKEYLAQMKEHYELRRKSEEYQEKVDVDGIKISKKLLNRESLKSCPVCESLPKTSIDDVCLIKFKCCGVCYDRYVFGREERWQEGWRPNETKQENT